MLSIPYPEFSGVAAMKGDRHTSPSLLFRQQYPNNLTNGCAAGISAMGQLESCGLSNKSLY